jgi:hypothetical protein
MYLANAYPNSALSAAALMVLGFVMVGALALWLGLVFLADRKSTAKEARQADSYLAVVAQPPEAEDGHSEAGRDEAGNDQAASRQGAAA